MELNDLLIKEGIDPKGVIVMRHCPTERELRKVLPWLAAERPETYNGYQKAQRPAVEKAMQKATYVASFIGHEAGKALFIALYRRGEYHPLTWEEYWQKRGGPGYLNRFSASISGASAGVRLPCGLAAG